MNELRTAYEAVHGSMLSHLIFASSKNKVNELQYAIDTVFSGQLTLGEMFNSNLNERYPILFHLHVNKDAPVIQSTHFSIDYSGDVKIRRKSKKYPQGEYLDIEEIHAKLKELQNSFIEAFRFAGDKFISDYVKDLYNKSNHKDKIDLVIEFNKKDPEDQLSYIINNFSGIKNPEKIVSCNDRLFTYYTNEKTKTYVSGKLDWITMSVEYISGGSDD